MNEKLKVNVYKGLPMILEKVKTIALADVIGKADSWMTMKLRHYEVKGRKLEFYESDIELINNALGQLGDLIARCVIEFSEDREAVIEQIKAAGNYVAMPYIYEEVLKQKQRWYINRMVVRKPGKKVCSFKEDDILKMNMGIMQIANELRSIELTL